MAFVAVFVFRQRLRQSEVERVLDDVPETFARLAQSRGAPFSPDKVQVHVTDGVPRNVFSPESHSKGFQGLDVLLLIFGLEGSEEDHDAAREALESQFRDRWVARARIFGREDGYWR